MTQIDFDNSFRKAAGAKRLKKMNLKIDMTPMVDLGFLLIAFFIFTTRLSQPAVMKLYMPKDGGLTKIPASRSLTILIGNKMDLYYYFGIEEMTVRQKLINQTFYNETAIGNVIRE